MNKKLTVILCIVLASLLCSGLAMAMESNQHEIVRDLFSGGGGEMSSASFSTDGTLGQAIVGFSSGDTAQLGSGFWHGEALPSSYAAYLPMASYHVPTPVPFPQLANGSFDLPGESGWQQSTTSTSTAGHDLIISADEIEGITAYSAPNVAWLGGTAGVTDDLWQEISLPAEHATVQLSYRYWIKSEEGNCDDDRFLLRVFANRSGNFYTVNRLSLCQNTATDGWQSAVTPMDDFVGQDIHIHFIASLDAAEASSIFIDDVKLCDHSAQFPCN